MLKTISKRVTSFFHGFVAIQEYMMKKLAITFFLLALIVFPTVARNIQKGETGVINNPGDVGMVLYTKPSFSGDTMITIMNGTPVTVISNPKDSEGYRWIQIRTNEGYEGWIFEAGVSDDDNFQPTSVVNSESQTDSTTSVVAFDGKVVSDGLKTSEKKTVIINNAAGYGMFLYSNPSFNSGVITMTLMNGTQVSVISDPKISEGIRWLMVRTDKGQEGWVFEEGIIDPADYHPVSEAVNNNQISYSNAGSSNSSNYGYYDGSLGSTNRSNN